MNGLVKPFVTMGPPANPFGRQLAGMLFDNAACR